MNVAAAVPLPVVHFVAVFVVLPDVLHIFALGCLLN